MSRFEKLRLMEAGPKAYNEGMARTRNGELDTPTGSTNPLSGGILR